MRILIFSDTHLDNRFDEKKYQFLVKLIESSDKVIINGDFWDSWYTDFDSFINSKWKGLFPLLLQKEAVYIYGNHDIKAKSDNRVRLFSVENTNIHNFISGKFQFLIEHGNGLLKNNRSGFLKIYGQVLDKVENTKLGELIHTLLHTLEWMGYKTVGSMRMTNSNISKHNNLIMKNHKRTQDTWLICGDTHCPEMDNILKYANSGCIIHGFASYLVIDNGEIILYRANY